MRTLEFVFKSDDKKRHSLKFAYAKDNITSKEAEEVMNRISALEMFKKDGVNLYAEPVSAQYVQRDAFPLFNKAVKA